MWFLRRMLVASALLALLSPSVQAQCNPNEDCNRCLVSAFGRCQHRGNDPVCETRKLACQRAGGGLGSPAGPGGPFGPGGPGGPGGPQPPIGPQQVQQCLANLAQCPPVLMVSSVRPIVEAYKQHLISQVRQWYRLDPRTIAKIQPFYSVDLNSIEFAYGINTVHGAHITFGNRIFFTQTLNMLAPADLHLMYHELEHSVQYQNRGGESAFIGEYILKAAGQILATRSFNVHDFIDLESAAESKANQVSAAVDGSAAQGPTGHGNNVSQAARQCVTLQGWCLVPPFMQPGAGCVCNNGPMQTFGYVQ